jgi:hypothetical protein
MGREFLDPISLRRLVYHIKDELSKYAKRTEIPSKLSELDNDSGYITEVPDSTETDPTVPAWAKEPTKPSYTASEVGALPNTTKIPTVVSDLKNDLGYLTEYTETDPTVSEWAKEPTKPSYTASEVGALPNTTVIPTKVSQLENDNGYLTEHQDVSGKADKATTLGGYGITDAYTKTEIDSLVGDIENALWTIDNSLNEVINAQNSLISGGDNK